MTDKIFDDDSFVDSTIENDTIPILESLGLGDLLIDWMTVENVVIGFTRWTCPDVQR